MLELGWVYVARERDQWQVLVNCLFRYRLCVSWLAKGHCFVEFSYIRLFIVLWDFIP